MSKPKLVALGGSSTSNAKDLDVFIRNLEIDVLARTLWGEARGEGTEGMQAVASVILNRVKIAQENGGHWWGNDIISVCQKPYQFSCWNRSDPNFQKLQQVNDSDLYFVTALRVARRAIYHCIEDTTGGATHYHAKRANPYWTKGQRASAIVGNHIFYKIEEG